MADPATEPLAPHGGDDGVKVVGGPGSSQPSLLRALAGAFGRVVLVSALLKLANDILIFVSPLLLK